MPRLVPSALRAGVRQEAQHPGFRAGSRGLRHRMELNSGHGVAQRRRRGARLAPVLGLRPHLDASFEGIGIRKETGAGQYLHCASCSRSIGAPHSEH